jgi:hypothetical protein
VFGAKQVSYFGGIEFFALEVVMGHDVKQGLKRRTRLLDAAVVKIHFGDAALCGHNIIDSIDEYLQILKLRAKHFFGEN